MKIWPTSLSGTIVEVGSLMSVVHVDPGLAKLDQAPRKLGRVLVPFLAEDGAPEGVSELAICCTH